MKNILLILFLFISSLTFSQSTYYVRADGNDANDGSDTTAANAWAGWQKAFDTADDGDTVFFMDRGGIWFPGDGVTYRLNPPGNGNAGTYADPIHFFNYPGERPIIDCINHTTAGGSWAVQNTVNVKFRGITMRNQKQDILDNSIMSLLFGGVGNENGNLHLDQMICYDGGGYGFWVIGWDTLEIVNCDSYGHYDSNDTDPGNTADGFTIGTGVDKPDSSKIMYFHGNRAWLNSDDGFELSPACQIDVYNNWVFNNGDRCPTCGGGLGYKLSHGYQTADNRKIHHNLVAWTAGIGMSETNLSIDTLGPVCTYYNNTIWKAQRGVNRVFGAFDPDDPRSTHDSRWVNNVVYNSTEGEQWEVYFADAGVPPDVFQKNNTWYQDDEASLPWWEYNDTVNWPWSGRDGQFAALPTDSADVMAILAQPRQADGSLPDIGDYFQLASGSDLIDAGEDTVSASIILTEFNGSAPDMGAFESGITDTSIFVLIDTLLAFSVTGDTIFAIISDADSCWWGVYNGGVEEWYGEEVASGTDNGSVHTYGKTFTHVVAPNGAQIGQVTITTNATIRNDSLIFLHNGTEYGVGKKTIDPR